MSSASGRPPAAIPPQRRDNSSTAVWWILGIVAGGIVVMVVFGLALAGLLIHNLHVHNQGQNVEIQTPVGGIKVNTMRRTRRACRFTPAQPPSIHTTPTWNFPQATQASEIAVEKYSTADELDQSLRVVRAKARAQFSPRKAAARNVKIQGVDANSDADVAFVDDHGRRRAHRCADRKNERVEIALVRVGKSEAQ